MHGETIKVITYKVSGFHHCVIWVLGSSGVFRGVDWLLVTQGSGQYIGSFTGVRQCKKTGLFDPWRWDGWSVPKRRVAKSHRLTSQNNEGLRSVSNLHSVKIDPGVCPFSHAVDFGHCFSINKSFPCIWCSGSPFVYSCILLFGISGETYSLIRKKTGGWSVLFEIQWLWIWIWWRC